MGSERDAEIHDCLTQRVFDGAALLFVYACRFVLMMSCRRFDPVDSIKLIVTQAPVARWPVTDLGCIVPIPRARERDRRRDQQQQPPPSRTFN